ncbi:MAG: alpha/beta hydrolase family protein [Limisphaerales bacterium]
MKSLGLVILIALAELAPHAAEPRTLAGTSPLTLSGDPASDMVAGLDRFLDRELAALPSRRAAALQRSLEALRQARESGAASSPGDELLEWLLSSATTNRTRLRHLLGVTDVRDPVQMRILATVGTNIAPDAAQLGRGPGYRLFAVAWNVFRGVEAEGLLLVPDGPPRADVIALPDCDWTPEQLAGLAPGLAAEEQFARRLAEHGCRVLVPVLIDRSDRFAGNPGVRSTRHSQRETLWRTSYEMGRTLAGYEIQKVLAAVDWMVATRQGIPEPEDLREWFRARSQAPEGLQSVGVIGYGEGGLVALYAAALDLRIRATAVSGYFGPRERLHDEPIYRNVWCLLRDFGDAEIARLVVPRPLWVEHGRYPEVEHLDTHGGAPGRLWTPTFDEVYQEVERGRLGDLPPNFLNAGPEAVGTWGTLARFYRDLQPHGEPVPQQLGPPPQATAPLPDAPARQLRQYRQILEDTQHLMREGEYARREFWKRADFSSLGAFTNSVDWYRDYFRDEIVGMIPKASLPPNARSRLLYETNGLRGYEIVLDVHPDVFAHGILVLPADLKPGERRTVVVCQHGLEGRPRDLADPAIDSPYYHQFALQLAARGFVTFSPQNPYLGGTRFRQVLRKAQPLGLTLWSFMVRQHEVITDWLAAQEFTDPQRIAFYGLSYGGKTAMRVPVLVDRYCLSICSADYNEWIWKNVSARSAYSYLWTSEYDMPEFNLGNTFNYAELSWLISPRPFMVERGHDDGVAPDEWVAFEYAKTRRHYVKLGLADRTEIEFFDGPHSIHGKGTFEFLERHLGPRR